MSCYHPLTALVLGYREDDSGHLRKIIKVIPKDDFTSVIEGHEVIKIPCGRCIGCRLKYSRIWADRCMCEANYHEHNVFLTLTYDNHHLPAPNSYNDEFGNVKTSPINPLVKRDLQLFIKRLRKKFPEQRIRYFACGEYGSSSMRPHYHILLFGLKLDDLQLLYRNDNQFRYYTSDSISSLWHYGFHIITSVNWQTCAYVARYIVKKQFGKGASIYEDYNFPPEFTLMSRRPGIGKQFFEDNKLRIYEDDVYISTQEGARKIAPNKYYDSLFDLEYPDYMFTIREDRKQIALVNESLKNNLTSLSRYDRLSSEEEIQEARAKILQRKGV